MGPSRNRMPNGRVITRPIVGILIVGQRIIMHEKDISLYCDLMEEIKKRIAVIQFFSAEKSATPYKATTIETTCLQIRKVLELIALGSLVANKKEFSKFYDEFGKMWNAKFILRDIKKVNPSFYPQPVVEKESGDPAVKNHLDNLKSGYLNEKRFVKVYEKCGAIMHADNPFGSKIDYSYYEKNIPIWVTEIMALLNNHYIKLVNSKNMYLVHMKEDRDNKVHAYTFSPVE